jgi:hypothetical protein
MGNPILLFETKLQPGAIVTTDMLPWAAHPFGVMPWEGQYSADAVINTRLYDRWEAFTNQAQEIYIDCGYEADISAIGFAGHNLKSAGCTVTLQACNSSFFRGSGSIITVLSAFRATSNRTIMKTFANTRRRYWKISFGEAIDPVHIGCLKLGRHLELPYPPDTPYAPKSYSQATEVLYSKAGQPLGAIRSNPTIRTTVQVSTIDRDWALKGWGDFTWQEITWADHGNIEWLRESLLSMDSLFYAWDYATYPNDVIFAMFDGEGELATPLTIARFIDSFTFTLISSKEA